METLSRSNRLMWLVLVGTLLLGARAGQCSETTALADLQAKAAAGDADAQYALGDIYYFGQGVSLDADAARKWYVLAADQQHAAAQFSLALIDSAGGAPQRGFVLPMLRGLVGSDTFPKDAKDGLASVQREAELGNANAQWKIGIAYATGTGVKQNETKGVEWLRRAAEQQLAFAQFSLGYAYDEGLGVRQNDDEAMTWYRRAADQGAALAQFVVGHAYEYGQGVPRDYAEAAKWYRLAAEQGDAEAQFNLGFFYESGTGVDKDPAEAVKWYRLSANQGYSRAMLNLGAANLEGVGTAQSYPDALFFFQLAAATLDPAVQSMAQNGIKQAKRHLDKAQIANVRTRIQEWIDSFRARTANQS